MSWQLVQSIYLHVQSIYLQYNKNSFTVGLIVGLMLDYKDIT